MSHVNFTSPGRMILNGYIGVSGTQPRAVSFWYNSNSTHPNSNGTGTICYWGDPKSDPVAGSQWKIDTIGSPAKIQVSARGTYRNTSISVDDGEWHNIIVTFPGGDGVDLRFCDIYVDGNLDDAGKTAPRDFSVDPDPGVATTGFAGAGLDVIIGARPVGTETVVGTGIPLTASGFDDFFEGGLDSFAIWSGTLGSAEIAAISGSRSNDLSVVASGTLAVWLQMGDVGGDTAGAAGTIQDSSGFGRDATTTAGTTISG